MQLQNLTYGDAFVTAGGTEEKSLGRTKSQLTICLAKGTDAETIVTSIAIIADTNAYDIILGMDFLGACFGYVDPMTEEFVWRTDCHDTSKMPTNIARLPAKCRTTMRRERRHVYLLQEVGNGGDLMDAMCENEDMEEEFPEEIQSLQNTVTAPVLLPTCRIASFAVSRISNLTRPLAVHRRHEASARLAAAHKKDLPPMLPRTQWIGGDNHCAVPIDTSIRKFDKDFTTKGLHVLDLFSGISCGGLRIVLEAGYKVSCYTSVEIDDVS